MPVTAINNPAPEAPDTFPTKLERGGYLGTAQTLDQKIEENLAEAKALINSKLVGSQIINGVTLTSAIPASGNIHTFVTTSGTYVNWNNLFVSANSLAVLMRIDGVFSISQTALDLSTYASKSYVDGLVVGLIDDRGPYNASVNTFPTTGGSGTSGAIKKGDLWFVSVAGTLSGVPVRPGACFRALVDAPAQIAANWAILDATLGFIPENTSNKNSDITANPTSTDKFPNNKAVVEYVDANGKIKPFIDKAHLANSQVNFLGKDWYNTVATVAGEIPGTSPKWVDRLSFSTDYINSIVKPIGSSKSGIDVIPNTLYTLNPTAQGFASSVLISKNSYIDYFSQFMYVTNPLDVITATMYTTSEEMAVFTPTSATTAIVKQQVFTGTFNSQRYKRFEWNLDTPIFVPSGKRLVIIFESSLRTLRNYGYANLTAPSGATSLYERREPKTNYYLDGTGYLQDYPILGLRNQLAIDLIKQANATIVPNILIPDTIYVPIGTEINIYADNVLGNLNGFKNYKVNFINNTLNWSSNSDSSGINNFGRYLRYKPTTANVLTRFVCQILDVNSKVVFEKTFFIKSISKTSGTGTKIILMAGDSLTEYIFGNGNYVKQVYDKIIADGGFTPVFIGTKTNSNNPLVKHEGYGGKTFGFFNGSQSPFWDAQLGEINFQTYATRMGVTSIDIFHIQSAINDVFAGVYTAGDYPANIITIKSLIDRLLSADKGFPNCKIILGIEPFGANGENQLASRNTDEMKRKVFELNKLIQETFYQDETGFKYHANVWTSPNYLTIDRDFGYPYSMVKVSEDSDADQLEKVFSDTVHPNAFGFKQIGNTVYSMIRRVLQ